MAYLLSGEQPAAAAFSNPFRAPLRWLGELRAAGARRLALRSLLELDDARLDDLGINRQDLFEAMDQRSGGFGNALSQRRARASSDWLGER